MTQEDKELLLKDLCGRLPYGEWEYFVVCQKELRQLELQILNNISVPLEWLNASQFDYRVLIPMGLKDMYKTE